MIFDLTRPLEEQWAKVKRRLRNDVAYCIENGMPKPAQSRNHRQMYPLYLRLLDAIEQKARQPEIIAEIFPNLAANADANQKYKDTLKAARRMRDRGFWGIR